MAAFDSITANRYTPLRRRSSPETDEEKPYRRPNSSGPSGSGSSGDGKVIRRGRGRPPGTKNKPKLPVIIKTESPNTLQAHILEFATGCDIFDCLASYSRRWQRGICILSGSGTVTDVRLRQPDVVTGAEVTLYGQFEIISLSGSFLPPPATPRATSLSILLAGGQGQTIGGSVVGNLMAAGPVVVFASTFTNVSYESLPIEEKAEEIPASAFGGGSGAQLPSPSSGLPVFNLPLGMQNIAVDGAWDSGNSAGTPAPFW